MIEPAATAESSRADHTTALLAEILAAAREAYAAGLCILPPAEDGTKRPFPDDAGRWDGFKEQRPTREAMQSWYPGRSGLGVVVGAVSRRVECWDFDDRETYEQFVAAAARCGLGALVERIEAGYSDATPGDGFRWLVRYPESIERKPSGIKLARRAKRQDEQRHEHDSIKTLIELPAFAIVAPSGGRVHPSGRPYVRLAGGFGTIAAYTEAERDALLELARSFDAMPRATSSSGSTSNGHDRGENRPGDDFNRRTTWETLLPRYGWTALFERDGVTFWRRPGKTLGISATTGFAGTDLFYPFTSSTPFEPERAYDRFGAFAVLEHGGDFAAAARDLAAKGYGERTERESTGGASYARSDGVGEGWPPRQPLPSALAEVPSLPDILLPPALRPWIADAADRLQVPPEMIAAPALVALGALVGRSLGLRPKRRDDWLVIPNLWGAVVGRPGVLKSPALLEGTRFLRRLSVEASERHARESADAEMERSIVELEITGLKKRGAAKGADPGALREELAALVEKRDRARAIERRYSTNDATVEKLGELLNENPRGILMLRDELSGWLRSLEKAGREGDREFYLEAWNGAGRFTVDRIGRGTLHVRALTLSVLGSIQPGKLRAYLEEAFGDGDGADGLLQRFQLIVWPDQPKEWRNVDRWPESESRERAWRAFHRIDALDAASVGATSDGDAEIPVLRFAPAAQELFDAWREELERRLRSAEFESSPAYEGHVAKFRSLMPALSLVSHLVDVVDGDEPGAVSLDAARRGAALVEFFDAHARRIYGVEIEPGRSTARLLAEKMEAGAIHDGDAIRDLYRPQWRGLRIPELVVRGARILADLGWVRLEERESGGRPSTVLRLHPDLRGASDSSGSGSGVCPPPPEDSPSQQVHPKEGGV